MKNKKLLIGLAALLLTGGGAGAYFLLFAPDPAEAAEEEAPREPAALVELAPFLTNIADQRKARVEVALAVAPPGFSEEIVADPLLVAQLRDKILTLLSARTYEELSSPAGKEQFREEIRVASQSILSEGEVQEALFVDFVIQ
jgi:flagellar FliL protein